MDFVSGKYRGPVPTDQQCLMQMAAGVGHLHYKTIVHRDIKPENVLIYGQQPSNPVLKIADFGLSKRTTERGSFSMSSASIGTLCYMAPELLQLMDKGEEEMSKRVSNASDVFALGCVYFIYLSRGTHPFGSDYQTFNKIVEGKFDLSSQAIFLLKNEFCGFLVNSSSSFSINRAEQWPFRLQFDSADDSD
jgi:serine/threonine protein kinase